MTNEDAIKWLENLKNSIGNPHYECLWPYAQAIDEICELLKEQEPDQSKYEYKYDHTDCLWYKSDDVNQCPSTCSQYRDGWNDAMNYIFKGGKGYQPYKRAVKEE